MSSFLKGVTMKRYSVVSALAVLPLRVIGTLIGSVTASAQEDQSRHEPKLIEFNAPDAATEISPACASSCGTQAFANNAEGWVVGSYTDKNVVAHGFLRSADGQFISFDAPEAGLVHEMDDGTFPFSINDLGVVAGTVQDSGNVFHGFVRYPDGAYTTFDVPGVSNAAFQGTQPLDINLAGATAGIYNDVNGNLHGFVRSLRGETTSYDPPGSVLTFVCEETCLNLWGETTGYFDDMYGVGHGYVREPDGEITVFDAPGADGFTIGASINIEGTITGYSLDSNNVGHSFVRTRDGKFTTFDDSQAGTASGQGTFAFSINLEGAITGQFTDANNINHGFVRGHDGKFTTIDARGAAPGVSAGTRPSTNNLRGQVAGWWVDGKGLNHGFVWIPCYEF
jgi:hypothetical protein